MTTNDFSKCKIGDALWSIQLGKCFVIERGMNTIILETENRRMRAVYFLNGFHGVNDMYQSLFFSNPNIIAPPEPPRLPDYKPGQWIAVWLEQGLPTVRKVSHFDGSTILCTLPNRSDAVAWSNHCTLEELPGVLANWEEEKR